jgi:hypothetical protein
MATVTKDFRVKAGLVVEGTTATVNGKNIITAGVVDAKGDLIVGSADDAVARLGVGSNGQVLTAASGATYGVQWSDPAAVGVFGSSIEFEGATANGFETTLEVTDPTADRTITLQNASGTVAFTSDITAAVDAITTSVIEEGTNQYFTDTRAVDAVAADLGDGIEYESGSFNVKVGSGLEIGGGTGNEIVIDRTTVDSWYDAAGSASAAAGDLSDHESATEAHGATGAVVGTTNTQTLTNKTLTSPIVDGDGVVFEGATANSFETTLTVVDPTADRTITLPNVTGTVITTGDSATVTNTMLAGSIANEKLSNSAITINGTSTSLGGSRTLGSDDIAEGSTNKYFTDERAQDAIGTVVGNGLDYDDSTGAISVDPSEFALSAVGAPTGNVSMATYKITGLGTPTDSTDAATKAYVDSATEGLHIHESVVAATTANVSLATALENGDTLDGVTLATGDRILVKNQTIKSQNGIYVVQTSGQPARATDFDTATEIDSGDFVFVYSGGQAGTGWVQTYRPVTIGTDEINFTQFSGAGTYLAGNGLNLNGTTFSIDTAITADLSTSQTLTNKTISGSANTLSNIANSSLTNSAITINGTSVSLGGTRTLGSDDISEGSTNKYFTDERAQDAVGNALGTGLSYNDSTGAISNSGVLSITGTSNQVVADVSTGAVTLSLPQSIHSAATPTFASLSVGSGALTAGSVVLPDALVGSALATAGTSATTIDTWSATTYSAAKYVVQLKKSGNIEVIEVLVAIDGDNNVYLTEYANVQSNGELGTTNAVYSGGNVLLQVTAAAADTSVKVSKTYIEA